MILRLLSFVFLALLTLFIIWGVGWLWFVTKIAIMEPDSTTTKTEAIIVLTGGNGRINEGLNLLAQKTAPKLFISGVNKGVTQKDIFKSWKKPTSPEPCCISLGYESTDTISNAIEVKQWVEENNINSFHLITSSYHMPRAVMEFQKQLPNTIIIKHPVFSSNFEAWSGGFLKITFGEYNKTILRQIQNINKTGKNP